MQGLFEMIGVTKFAAALLACGLAASGAWAAKPVPSPEKPAGKSGDCATAGVFASGFSFIQCAGGFEKNALGNSKGQVATQVEALGQLGLKVPAESFDLASYFKIDKLNDGDVVLPEGQMMFGTTIFGIHFGNGSVLGNATAFYKFDAGKGTNQIPLSTKGSSGFVLYDTGEFGEVVPEPATWAMMIAGFGMVGGAMRRRRRDVARVAA